MISRVLLIDNFDSFTFNLAESFQRLGCEVRTLRNTIAASDALATAEQSGALIVLSPGPGAPGQAGCCLELVAKAEGKLPLLGVCLGHQAIVQQAGGTIGRAPLPVHGKATVVHHDGKGPFEGIRCPARVGRYHSLCTRDIPARFTIHAEVDGMAMAVTDPAARQTGLQFHPESVLTTYGDRMLENVLAGAGR